MCTVSMVVGTLTNPASTNFIPWGPLTPTPDVSKRLLDVIDRLEKIDKRLGLIECSVEAKKKRAFKAKLRRRAGR